jgi:hypothetical protein
MPAQRKKTVSITTQINQYPGIFREDNGIMFCNFCDLSIEWRLKSIVDGHCLSKSHIKKKQTYERNTRRQKQVTILAFESKKEVIEDLIEAFSLANIPLEKINNLLPFFKKYLKEGGAISQAPTLYQIHLPHVFNNHLSLLQNFFK